MDRFDDDYVFNKKEPKRYGKQFESDKRFKDILSDTSISKSVSVNQQHMNINSLTAYIDKANKEMLKEIKGISSSVNTPAKKVRESVPQLKMQELAGNKAVKNVEKSVQQMLGKLGYTVDEIAKSSKKMITSTANITQETLKEYGRALQEDFSINKPNLVAAIIAKASPIFGYFAGKFMETDVFKSFGERIKMRLSNALTFSINKMFDLFGRAKNLFSRRDKGESVSKLKSIPKMATGGYVKKGGLARIHSAEVVAPLDKLAKQISIGFEPTRESLTDELRKTRMATVGIFQEFPATIQSAIWKHPLARQLVSSFSIVSGVFDFLTTGLFGKRNKYTMMLSRNKNPLIRTADNIGVFFTQSMLKFDILISHIAELIKHFTGKEPVIKKEKTWTRFQKLRELKGKKDKLSSFLEDVIEFGAGEPETDYESLLGMFRGNTMKKIRDKYKKKMEKHGPEKAKEIIDRFKRIRKGQKEKTKLESISKQEDTNEMYNLWDFFKSKNISDKSKDIKSTIKEDNKITESTLFNKIPLINKSEDLGDSSFISKTILNSTDVLRSTINTARDLIVYHISKLGKIAKEQLNETKETKGFLKKKVGGGLDTLFSILLGVWSFLKTSISKLFNGVRALGSVLRGGGLIKGAGRLLSSPAGRVVGGVAGAAMAGYDAYQGIKESQKWGTSKTAGAIGGVLGGTSSGVSGAVSGIAKGAAIGLAFGPIGAGIGALIGGVAGFIGGENLAKSVDWIWEKVKGLAQLALDVILFPFRLLGKIKDRFVNWLTKKVDTNQLPKNAPSSVQASATKVGSQMRGNYQNRLSQRAPSENWEKIKSAGSSILSSVKSMLGFPEVPANSGVVTSEFGPRDTGLQGASKYHQGIDLRAKYGEPIKSLWGGKVESYDPKWGTLSIRHPNDYISNYTHLSGTDASVGSVVNKGEIIGSAGKTGPISGMAPHLHLGIKDPYGNYVNPRDVFESSGIELASKRSMTEMGGPPIIDKNKILRNQVDKDSSLARILSDVTESSLNNMSKNSAAVITNITNAVNNINRSISSNSNIGGQNNQQSGESFDLNSILYAEL